MNPHSNSLLMVTAEIADWTRLRDAQPEVVYSAASLCTNLFRTHFQFEGCRVDGTFEDLGVVTAICMPGLPPIEAAAAFVAALKIVPVEAELRVRTAIHLVDQAETSIGSHADARHAAMLRGAAHGGQILISAAAQRTLIGVINEPLSLHDLGTHQFADLCDAEHVFQLISPGIPHVFPPARSLNGALNNLPAADNRFIGREDDLVTVRELLQLNRFVTLIGAPGIGKTRLAIQAAATLLDTTTDGVWFVDFPRLPDPTLVTPAIAAVLKVHEDPANTLLEALIASIQHKQLLLVLNNVSPVRRACAAILDTILARCPGVRVLAAETEGIGAKCEAICPVRALSLPFAGNQVTPQALRATEAGELFNDWATNANEEFVLAHSTASAAARIVIAAAGIPGALRLLAHNFTIMDLEQIAQDLTNKAELSAAGGCQTYGVVVRGIVEWCFNRLEPAAQSVLSRLSVMIGPWTQAAMQAVAPGGSESVRLNDPLSIVNTLVRYGMMSARTQSGVVRYRMPDLVRDYVGERLDSVERLRARRRYAEYYLKMAEQAGSDLSGTDAARMALWLEKEYPNFCAALAWCKEDPQQAASGLQLARSLRRFWEVRGYPAEGQAMLLRTAVWGDNSERSTARADSLKRAGDTAFQGGNVAVAKACHQEALSINRELGDKVRIAINLNNLGNVARAEGDHVAAQVLHEEALRTNREMGDIKREAVNLHNLGNALRDQGHLDEARERYVEAITLCHRQGDRMGIGHNLNSLARLAFSVDDRAEALRLYEEALVHFRASGSEPWVAHNLGEIVKLNLRPAPFWAQESVSA